MLYLVTNKPDCVCSRGRVQINMNRKPAHFNQRCHLSLGHNMEGPEFGDVIDPNGSRMLEGLQCPAGHQLYYFDDPVFLPPWGDYIGSGHRYNSTFTDL